MEDILAKILKQKAERVRERKRKLSLHEIERIAVAMPFPTFDFLQSLKHAAPQGIHVIAEVKKASPSKGLIRENFQPLAIAEAYLRGGATALSVLTEEDFFLGSDDYLQTISATIPLPTLRKDFIFDPYQIFEAKMLGASAFLLIVACLEESELKEYMALGRDLGLTPLVEAHDETETETALRAGAELLGINNRNLRTFEISLETTFRLRKRIPMDIPCISESGIFTREDVLRLQAAGVQGVLVGESLMREADEGAKLRELLGITYA